MLELATTTGYDLGSDGGPVDAGGRRVDDAEAWRAARDGDQAAFASLFERYADALYNVAFRRAASWTVAEDIVATVCSWKCGVSALRSSCTT